jgi:hypothetical protein
MRSRLLASIALLSLAASAQDYPYDESPVANGDVLPVEKPADALRRGSTDAEPVEAPAAGGARKRANALFRVGVKAGLNFALLHAGDAGNFSGIGIEAAVSAGWDLPYQPIFLELETGYRNHFLTDNPTHIIPLKFGVFYRERVGARNLWKPGVGMSLDARIETDSSTGGKSFALMPSLHLSSLWELDAFLVEPMISIYRVQSSLTSLAFALRGGYRF